MFSTTGKFQNANLFYLGIYAAVTRRTLDDQNPDGWVPEQKITVEEALRAYTQNGAYASFEENIKGTLEPGKAGRFCNSGQGSYQDSAGRNSGREGVEDFCGREGGI